MKLLKNEEVVVRTVKDGRLVELGGIGRLTKGMTFPGENVNKNARVPLGAPINYMLEEMEPRKTMLTVRYYRRGEMYTLILMEQYPLTDAAQRWGLEDF